MTTPRRKKDRQKFSIYHSGGNDSAMKAWMAPYADHFRGCENVLDVGCGPGHFLELLQERGIPELGIDFDPDMVATCTGKGLHAEVADARTLSGWMARFDGIHAGHVIEHMDGETALGFLEQCTEALKPGGKLVIRTPNWENPIVRHGGFWLDHTHVRPYPLPLLQRMLEDLGYAIVAAGAEPNGWNDLFIVGVKLVDDGPSLHIDDLHATNFLLVARTDTDWVAALKTYYTTFGPDDDTTLVLYLPPDGGLNEVSVLSAFADAGLDPEHGPTVVVVAQVIENDVAGELGDLLQARLQTSPDRPPWSEEPLPVIAPTAEAMQTIRTRRQD